jgi:glycosyltransferase involved in cell wall biosynthesis
MIDTKKHLNIAVICDSIESMAGGMFVSIYRYLTELKSQGHTVIIITTKVKEHKGNSRLFAGFTIYRFMTTFPFGTNKFRFALLKQSDLEKIFSQHNIDIVYTVQPVYSSYIAIKTAKKMNIPVVAHWHLQPENLISNNPLLAYAKKALYMYLLYFFNKSNLIICPSEFARKMLIAQKVKIPTKVISNGVSLKQFTLLPPEEIDYVFNKYGLDKKKRYLIMLGRLASEKNLTTAIRAMPLIQTKMSDVELLIIGKGHLYSQLKRLVKKLKMSDQIHLLNKVPNEDIAPLLNTGSLFVHTSLIELECIAVLEAMACGLPLLISDSTNSAAHSLIAGNGTTFKAKNYHDLANKIVLLLQNQKQLAEMAQQSKNTVEKYDLQRSIGILTETFLQVVKQHKSGNIYTI